MDLSNIDLHIDSEEVLAHLNGLGYLNVSPDQLESFTADLKKLIKYDVRRCNCSIESLRLQALHSLDLNGEDEETENVHACNLSASNTSSSVLLNVEGGHRSTMSKHRTNVYQNTMAGPSTAASGHNSGSENIPAGHRTLTTHGCNSGSENAQAGQYIYERKTIRGSVLVKKPSKEKKSSKESKEEAMITYKPSHSSSSLRAGSARPRSSFIKSRQLQAPSQVRRSDPVALYHKYQSYWRQQKVPGDNRHELLRWSVREKMLGGGDPGSRPVSRAASVDRVNRPSWNFR